MIDYETGLGSAFLHSSEILVREGQHVKRGEPISQIGATGVAIGTHLRSSMKWNAPQIPPILLTGAME